MKRGKTIPHYERKLNMKNKDIGTLFSMAFCCMLFLSGCELIRPFFIKNKKKEDRKEKRVERKIERKENKIDKTASKLGELKGVIAKKDSLPATRKDTLMIKPLDTAYVNVLMNAKHMEYATYQCRAKMHFESEKDKQNFSINFRVRKDSVIWASITAPIIGEVARAVITPDSVKAIERINKRAYLYSYLNLQKLINVQLDFNTLQDLIIGNAISRNGVVMEIKDLGLLSNIFIKGPDFTNQLTYTLADSSLKQIQLQTSRPASSSSLLIAMSQYQWVDMRFLPTFRQYHILDIKGAIQMEMDISKAEFDKEVSFPFSVPRNYSEQQ